MRPLTYRMMPGRKRKRDVAGTGGNTDGPWAGWSRCVSANVRAGERPGERAAQTTGQPGQGNAGAPCSNTFLQPETTSKFKLFTRKKNFSSTEFLFNSFSSTESLFCSSSSNHRLLEFTAQLQTCS